MSIDLESLYGILKHPIRRRIVLTLFEKQNLTYVDLMNLLEVKNTGQFNYHLKILGDLTEKDGSGKYRLTEKGLVASEILQKFPEKTSIDTQDKTVKQGIGVGLAMYFLLAMLRYSRGISPDEMIVSLAAPFVIGFFAGGVKKGLVYNFVIAFFVAWIGYGIYPYNIYESIITMIISATRFGIIGAIGGFIGDWTRKNPGSWI